MSGRFIAWRKGAVSLIQQRRPDLTPEEIESALGKWELSSIYRERASVARTVHEILHPDVAPIYGVDHPINSRRPAV